MNKFLNQNKVLLVNLLLIILILISYFISNPDYSKLKISFKYMGVFGLTCSIVNWFGLHLLLEKLSFLFTMDKIRNNLEPVKDFLIKEVFASKNYQDFKEKYVNILTDQEKLEIEKAILNLNFENITKLFNVSRMKDDVKNNILNKIFEIEDAVRDKIIEDIKNDESKITKKDFFNDEILPIIETKLELSVFNTAQSSIYKMIKNYFAWFVVWGGSCGLLFGLLISFMEIF